MKMSLRKKEQIQQGVFILVLIAIIALFFATNAHAGSFGGSRGGGGFSGGGRSYSAPSRSSSSFGGSRSSSQSAPIVRSNPSNSSASAPSSGYAPSSTTTVIHNDSGPSFWQMYWLAHAANSGQPQVTVVAPASTGAAAGSVPQVVVAERHSDGLAVVMVIFFLAMGGIGIWVYVNRKEIF